MPLPSIRSRNHRFSTPEALVVFAVSIVTYQSIRARPERDKPAFVVQYRQSRHRRFMPDNGTAFLWAACPWAATCWAAVLGLERRNVTIRRQAQFHAADILSVRKVSMRGVSRPRAFDGLRRIIDQVLSTRSTCWRIGRRRRRRSDRHRR